MRQRRFLRRPRAPTAERSALRRLARSAERSAHRTAETAPYNSKPGPHNSKLGPPPPRSATFRSKTRPALTLTTAFALPRRGESRGADRRAPAQECLLARGLTD